MKRVAPPHDPNLLLGFDTSDDAAVYRIDNHTAGVLTLDFFTPVVDDPYEYGAIAAANALSDVFAMGARPVTALNIVAFPRTIGTDVLGEVLRGGSDKVVEAGAFTVGGHTIEDDEPKYGLSVFGLVDPEKILRNTGAQVGDALFYTKKLGTGIATSALRAGALSDEQMRPAIAMMMELNKKGADAMARVHVHAATDVTGFGFAGHLHEMLEGSGVAARVHWSQVPVLDGMLELSAEGMRPGKTFNIKEWARDFVPRGVMSDTVYDERMGVLCDPQTSGGLLVAVPAAEARAFADAFQEAAGREPALVGEVVDGPAGMMFID